MVCLPVLGLIRASSQYTIPRIKARWPHRKTLYWRPHIIQEASSIREKNEVTFRQGGLDLERGESDWV